VRQAYLKTSACPQRLHTNLVTTERKNISHSYVYPLIDHTYLSEGINSREKSIGSKVTNLIGYSPERITLTDWNKKILVDPNKTTLSYNKAPRGVSNDKHSKKFNSNNKWRTNLRRSNPYENFRKKRETLNDISGTIQDTGQRFCAASLFITSAQPQSFHTYIATSERKNRNHSHVYSLINHPCLNNSINSQEKPIQSDVQNIPGYSPNSNHVPKWSVSIPRVKIKWKSKLRFKSIKKTRLIFYTAKLQQALSLNKGPNPWGMVRSAADAYDPILYGHMVKMNVYCCWLAALSFFFVDFFRRLLFLFLLASPPMLLSKSAGARADTIGRDGIVYPNVRARDITMFHKSPEALLPGALSSSETSILALFEDNVEEGIGLNTDDEPLF
jgi:hypothetical protein